jgi:hypothetical protein
MNALGDPAAGRLRNCDRHVRISFFVFLGFQQVPATNRGHIPSIVCAKYCR